MPADTDILPELEDASTSVQRPLHLILIDGSGFIFRAFHALPPMTRPDGTPVIKQKPIGPAEVMEKFCVTPDKMVEVQALIGDSADNVPVHAFAHRSVTVGSRCA
jgi:5'-3' exonuclease